MTSGRLGPKRLPTCTQVRGHPLAGQMQRPPPPRTLPPPTGPLSLSPSDELTWSVDAGLYIKLTAQSFKSGVSIVEVIPKAPRSVVSRLLAAGPRGALRCQATALLPWGVGRGLLLGKGHHP